MQAFENFSSKPRASSGPSRLDLHFELDEPSFRFVNIVSLFSFLFFVLYIKSSIDLSSIQLLIQISLLIVISSLVPNTSFVYV